MGIGVAADLNCICIEQAIIIPVIAPFTSSSRSYFFHIMSTTQIQSRLSHLHQSARSLTLSSPAVAAFLESECDRIARAAAMVLPSIRREQICGACGNIFPVHLGSPNHDTKKRRKRHVVRMLASPSKVEDGKRASIECNRCSRKTLVQPMRVYSQAGPQAPKPQKAQHNLPSTEKFKMQGSTSEIDSSSKGPLPATKPEPVPTKSTESKKQRMKARKRGGLQAEIDRSKVDGDFGLDLMDLMKEG